MFVTRQGSCTAAAAQPSHAAAARAVAAAETAAAVRILRVRGDWAGQLHLELVPC
jgi:hypothetical protein